MNNEQMKRIGMFARFDGVETVDVPAETVEDPNPGNPDAGSSINKFLEDNGIEVNKLAVEDLSTIQEKPGEGGDYEYELVKEKKPAAADKRHKFVRMALIALALLVAYRLFFSKRR